MITEVVIKLINVLDEKTSGFLEYYKKYNRWQKFSEYTLYFLFAQEYNYYENNSDIPGSISGVWSKKDSIYNLNNKSIFFVIQSHLNINIQTINNFLSNRLNTNLNYSYITIENISNG